MVKRKKVSKCTITPTATSKNQDTNNNYRMHVGSMVGTVGTRNRHSDSGSSSFVSETNRNDSLTRQRMQSLRMPSSGLLQ